MIGIIGGGALGLLLGNILKLNNVDFKIFNDGKVGKKILQSGNGRCNIGNIDIKMGYYHNPKFIDFTIYKDDVYETLDNLGIYVKTDEEGRLYPLSESSKSVLNILLKNIKDDIITEKITKITKNNNSYSLNNYSGFDKVVISTGSNASINDPNYYELLDNLGIDYKKFIPSLVGFKTKNNFKSISGTRSSGIVKLYNDNKLIKEESGKFIFKDDGINGISIMNLSSYYVNLDKIVNPYLVIDFYQNKDFENYESLFEPKLYEYILKNNIDIHNFKLDILSTYDINTAQVGHGGIKLDLINDDLSLKTDNNIYAGGEVIDIDGLCGGYNLYFAFASAFIISKSILKEE